MINSSSVLSTITKRKISSISHAASHALDDYSGVASKDKKVPERKKKQRRRRVKSASSNVVLDKSLKLSEILGAIQHGLHHVYKSTANLIGKIILETGLMSSQASIAESESKKKLVDLIGNIVFIGIVVYLIFGGAV